jgi:hypothetical protein
MWKTLFFTSAISNKAKTFGIYATTLTRLDGIARSTVSMKAEAALRAPDQVEGKGAKAASR